MQTVSVRLELLARLEEELLARGQKVLNAWHAEDGDLVRVARSREAHERRPGDRRRRAARHRAAIDDDVVVQARNGYRVMLVAISSKATGTTVGSCA